MIRKYNINYLFILKISSVYKCHTNSKHVNPPKCDITQIKLELKSKLISQCIRKAWNGILTNQTEEESLSTTRSWNHEDALAEAKELIATWNFALSYQILLNYTNNKLLNIILGTLNYLTKQNSRSKTCTTSTQSQSQQSHTFTQLFSPSTHTQPHPLQYQITT
jgi:hypothetical protein